VHKVKCKVCSKIEWKDKLLTLKFDNFWKHNGRRKALVVIPGVCKVRKFYMKKNSIYDKNEHLYANVKKHTIAN
jgi:hypothetical protein